MDAPNGCTGMLIAVLGILGASAVYEIAHKPSPAPSADVQKTPPAAEKDSAPSTKFQNAEALKKLVGEIRETYKAYHQSAPLQMRGGLEQKGWNPPQEKKYVERLNELRENARKLGLNTEQVTVLFDRLFQESLEAGNLRLR